VQFLHIIRRNHLKISASQFWTRILGVCARGGEEPDRRAAIILLYANYFSSAPIILKNILLNNRLELLNNSEENCKILRNGKLIKNDNISGKFDHKTFKFVSKKLMEIIGVDNFDLDLSSFKKIINDNSIFFSNFISQFKFDFKLKCYSWTLKA